MTIGTREVHDVAANDTKCLQEWRRGIEAVPVWLERPKKLLANVTALCTADETAYIFSSAHGMADRFNSVVH
jgi:hypothetical protein